jgi:mono/diheme cytochrome c family protein
MRERWARWLAMATGGVVVVLAATFALAQNPREEATARADRAPAAPEKVAPEKAAPAKAGDDAGPAAATEAETAALVALGKQVYEAQRCARCHAIAGEGNPRSPLDGVSELYDDDRLLQWIIGGDDVAEDLSARVMNAKQRYRDLPKRELDALVAYLKTI